MPDRYTSYQELAASEREGVDFHVRVHARPGSRVAVIAPHGGAIERNTSAVARAIAGDDLNLYLFEGNKPEIDNHAALHLTSHRFDEPRCLALIAPCDTVIAVHGWAVDDARVLIGGRDEPLKALLAAAFQAAGVTVDPGVGRMLGVHPTNICNRGRSGCGVQLELSDRLRDAEQWDRVAAVVRAALRAAPSALTAPAANPAIR